MHSKSKLFQTVLPRLVSILMIINGAVNIIVALLPLFNLHRAYQGISQFSDVVELIPSEQANTVLTIIIGLILIALGIGLFRRSRTAWRWAILMLVLLIIGSLYPELKQQTLILASISLVILLVFHNRFRIRSRGIKVAVIIAWLSVFFALGYGSVGSYLLRTQFHNLHSFVDAVYYTFVTYSTIGYGDITPATANAKLFVVTMVVVGVGAFATAITVLIVPLVEKRLKRLFRVVERFSHMREHTILCGYNHLTIHIARGLQTKDLSCLFVVGDHEKAAKVEQAGFEVLVGDPTLHATLEKTSLFDSHYIVCAFGDDATNILIGITAKAILNKSKAKCAVKIIARIENPENIEKAKQVGVDEVISPIVLSTQKILDLVEQKIA